MKVKKFALMFTARGSQIFARKIADVVVSPASVSNVETEIHVHASCVEKK